jgi:catechol 2,3-dioxygenase-like lactoylglutathione lyase family enzyme
LESAEQFYTGLVGLQVAFRQILDQEGKRVEELPLNLTWSEMRRSGKIPNFSWVTWAGRGEGIALMEKPRSTGQDGRALDHLGFVVSRVAFEELVRRTRQAGISPEREGEGYLRVVDPDGIRLDFEAKDPRSIHPSRGSVPVPG